jgi:hypothetical protein
VALCYACPGHRTEAMTAELVDKESAGRFSEAAALVILNETYGATAGKRVRCPGDVAMPHLSRVTIGPYMVPAATGSPWV